MVKIYVLKLENDKWYVGKTSNLSLRIEDHVQGFGSVWTSKHKLLKIEQIYENCDSFDEDKYVKKYMALYGIDNVRGGSYSRMQIDSAQKILLEREIRGATDKCFKCGQHGHFADKCIGKRKLVDELCYKCRCVGHFAKECKMIKSKKRKNNEQTQTRNAPKRFKKNNSSSSDEFDGSDNSSDSDYIEGDD